MNNSTNQHILEIIEKDDCPFTEYEVYGFFTGLVLSSHEKKILQDKATKFLDLSKESVTAVDELLEDIKEKISDSSFEIYGHNYNDFDNKASSISEWANYFLMSFDGATQQDKNDLETQQILDIFTEVSQINQKYMLDEKENVTKESLNDIDSFLVKSTLYLFNKNNDK